MEGEKKKQEEEGAGVGAGVGGEEKRKMKVVIAIDESESSLYALTWALDHLFAQPATPVELMLVHVIQPFQQFVYPAGPGVTESVKKAQQQNAEALITRASQTCREKGVEPQALLVEGDPKEMICQAVDQLNADLAIVGSRGLGKIKRAFLGSVSDYCAHHAKCPIMIVKPPK